MRGSRAQRGRRRDPRTMVELLGESGSHLLVLLLIMDNSGALAGNYRIHNKRENDLSGSSHFICFNGFPRCRGGASRRHLEKPMTRVGSWARNNKWLPYIFACLCVIYMYSSMHGIMNGFPTYASHTWMLMMKKTHWWREAIHNSVPIKMRR
jgi:hypothetical protein